MLLNIVISTLSVVDVSHTCEDVKQSFRGAHCCGSPATDVNFPVNAPGTTPLSGTQRLECIETFNGAKTGLLGIPGAHRKSVLTSTTWSGQYCDALNGCSDSWFHNATKFSVSTFGSQRFDGAGASWHVAMTYTPEEALSSKLLPE